MTIVNHLCILISGVLLILCMLTPLRRKIGGRAGLVLRGLSKPHTLYGILLLFTSLFHGVLSGNKPGMVSGKLAWFCLLLLLLLSAGKKRRGRSAWIKLHRRLAGLLCAWIAVHIVWAMVF